MTSENNGMFQMPVMPAYSGMGNGGFGFDGNSGWWILILLILFGGWGNNGFGNNGNGGVGADIQRGFDQSALTNGINGLQTGINGIQTSLCNGFASVNQGAANGFAQAEIAANSRQMADMQQNFAIQNALQQCCCENRAATADLKYTMATEAANTRAAGAANTQAIMDKLCQLELDGVKQQLADAQNQNTQLRTQLLVAQGQASQTAQTAQILANNEAQTAALERYLAPTPVPAYMVQNPNCCSQFGYGSCGCGAA